MPTQQTRYKPLIQRASSFFGGMADTVGDFAENTVDTVQNRLKYVPLVAKGVVNTVKDVGGDALDTALGLLREEEGLRTEAYQDQTGKWTIGFGNTMIDGRPVHPGERISEQQAEQLMRDSVQNQYTSFKNKIQRPLTPEQFAALTSFEYNLGSGIWNQAKDVIQKINAGDFAGAGALMQAYNKSKNPNSGQLEVNPVLAKRRKREAALLQDGGAAGSSDSYASGQYVPLSQRNTINSFST